MIIAIVPADEGGMLFNPGSDAQLQVGDLLIVLGDVERIAAMRTEGCNDNRSLSDRVSKYNFTDKLINKQF